MSTPLFHSCSRRQCSKVESKSDSGSQMVALKVMRHFIQLLGHVYEALNYGKVNNLCKTDLGSKLWLASTVQVDAVSG